MMKYAFGISALLAFGEATRLNAKSNEDYPAPTEVEDDDYLAPTEVELAEKEEHPTPTDLAQMWGLRSMHSTHEVEFTFYNAS